MRSLPSALLLSLALGCSGNGDVDMDQAPDLGESAQDMGQLVDMGEPEPDMGTPDMGPPDCSTNPNQCAPMQQLDMQCRCLESCDGGLVWNPIAGICEEPPAGECNVDADCPTSDGVCLNLPMAGGIEPCMGEDTCTCFIECDPFVGLPMSGCSPGEACTWLGNPPGVMAEAVCLPEGQGGQQADPCMANTDCNRNQNFFCTGATMTSTGACARVCSSGSPGLCQSLGDFSCADLNDPNLPGIGLCRATPPLLTDIGNTCGMGPECQSGLCSTVLQNTCSAGCGGVETCPGGSVCVGFTGANLPPGEESLCIAECPSADAAGDMFCNMRSPNLICRDILANGPPLCTPRCTVIGCADMAQTCDMASGRCM